MLQIFKGQKLFFARIRTPNFFIAPNGCALVKESGKFAPTFF